MLLQKEYDGDATATVKSGIDFDFKNGSVIAGDDVSLTLKYCFYYEKNSSGRSPSAGE